MNLLWSITSGTGLVLGGDHAKWYSYERQARPDIRYAIYLAQGSWEVQYLAWPYSWISRNTRPTCGFWELLDVHNIKFIYWSDAYLRMHLLPHLTMPPTMPNCRRAVTVHELLIGCTPDLQEFRKSSGLVASGDVRSLSGVAECPDSHRTWFYV